MHIKLKEASQILSSQPQLRSRNRKVKDSLARTISTNPISTLFRKRDSSDKLPWLAAHSQCVVLKEARRDLPNTSPFQNSKHSDSNQTRTANLLHLLDQRRRGCDVESARRSTAPPSEPFLHKMRTYSNLGIECESVSSAAAHLNRDS